MQTEMATARPRVRRVRVLIVDDDEDFRTLLRLRLKADGRFLVVGEAEDGSEALSLADEAEPDAIVLDLSMPVMDGLEVLRLLRKHHPDMKAIVLSGTDAIVMAEKATSLGAYAYLEKGTSLEQILTVLAPLAPPEFE